MNRPLADVRYFSPTEDLHFRPPSERLRIVIITSVRDLVAEKVGSNVRMPEGSELYVRGTLEQAIDELRGGELSRYVELVAIITDDLPKDLQASGYPAVPQKGRPWVHPLNLKIDGRTQARELYFHIPSRHRLLPLKDEARPEAKRRFEDTIRSIMKQTGAEVLVSDHFIGRIEYLIREDAHNLFGKVLNTHPGITDPRHPFPSPGLWSYETAIKRARGEEGEGRHGLTGSSFHVIDQGFDTGPVLCDTENTPVHPNDSLEALIARNYRLSNPFAFRGGLMHYAAHLWPKIGTIDWKGLREIRRIESAA